MVGGGGELLAYGRPNSSLKYRWLRVLEGSGGSFPQEEERLIVPLANHLLSAKGVSKIK